MQNQFFDAYRAGLKNAADIMTAMQSAIEDQARSVRELSEVRTVDELMAVQTRLASSQLERTIDLWTRLWRTAGDNQLAIIGQAQSQLGQLHEGVLVLPGEQRAA